MRRRFCRPPTLQDALPLPAKEADPSLLAAAGALPPTDGTSPRRSLALHLPWLATERLRASDATACWATEGSRRVLTAVNAEAAAARLHPGQALADAQAILPGLVLHPADPAADLAWLRRLALWSLAITPLPAVDPPDGLLLDVTGVAHLHGDEAMLLHKVVARFARAGITVRAAIAGAPAAAAALARGGRHGVVIPPGGERAAVAPLPLMTLRLPSAMISALHRLGLRCIGDVLRQPRGPLARRFGRTAPQAGGMTLLEALDAVTGLRAQPIMPLRPPPEFTAEHVFLEPIVTREAIDATLDALLASLCRQLAEAGRGARRLVLLAFRVDGDVQGVTVSTGLAARDPHHFARLFREKLGRLAPGFGFDRLVLEARATEQMTGIQGMLPGKGGFSPDRPHAFDRGQALVQLLDRLSQRLPVWRLAPRLSHWPERAVLRTGPFESVVLPEGWPGRIRPPRLLRRPVPLQAVAPLPDGPPALLRAGRASWRVTRAEGPERIEPEWWREALPAKRDRLGQPDQRFRDYYRVELASGARLWVCRSGLAMPDEPVRWWLHGRFE